VPRVVRLPGSAGALVWRVRYHYGSERDEKRGLVSADALFATLATGTVPGARQAAGEGCYRAPDWLAFSCARSRRRRAEASPGSRARAALYSRTASR